MLWRPRPASASEASLDARLPPGQRWVKGWPVLHEGEVPRFDPETWRLRVWGAVEQPLSLTWEEVCALPPFEITRDWHCVTTWSKQDNRWGGVAVADLLARARPTADARHVLVHCFDAVGYTTNLTREDFEKDGNLLASHHNGAPLEPRHGGPLRLVVHHLYAWKSAKWVSGIELLTADQRGYWEVRGYHNRADPWREERYSDRE